jgi:hypothetical protein
VTASILNKQSQTNGIVGVPVWGLGVGIRAVYCEKNYHVTKFCRNFIANLVKNFLHNLMIFIFSRQIAPWIQQMSKGFCDHKCRPSVWYRM